MDNTKAPALLGLDYVRDKDWNLVKKTRCGWERYANRMLKRNTGYWKFPFAALVVWIPWRESYRIHFAGQLDRR